MSSLAAMPRIMVVEDEKDLLIVVRLYLVRWGFDV